MNTERDRDAAFWRGRQPDLPPSDARPWAMPVREGAYVDEPGNAADGEGAGHWTVTRPLPWEAHLAGEPVLRVRIASSAPDVNVVTHLYDVAPDGTTTFVQRGGLAPRSSGEQEVRFASIRRTGASGRATASRCGCRDPRGSRPV